MEFLFLLLFSLFCLLDALGFILNSIKKYNSELDVIILGLKLLSDLVPALIHTATTVSDIPAIVIPRHVVRAIESRGGVEGVEETEDGYNVEGLESDSLVGVGNIESIPSSNMGGDKDDNDKLGFSNTKKNAKGGDKVDNSMKSKNKGIIGIKDKSNTPLQAQENISTNHINEVSLPNPLYGLSLNSPVGTGEVLWGCMETIQNYSPPMPTYYGVKKVSTNHNLLYVVFTYMTAFVTVSLL